MENNLYWVMRRAWAFLLLLYILGLHSSMAIMEIAGWSLTLCAIVNCTRQGMPKLVRENRVLMVWLVALVLAVLLPLVLEPQQKSMLFQFGYMRWTVLLWGLALSLSANWNAAFEKRLLQVWMIALGVAGAYGFLQCVTG